MSLDKFIAAFQAAFPGREILRQEHYAVIPGACADLGLFRVAYDSDEFTVFAGDLTHGHFGPGDGSFLAGSAEQEVIADMMDFFTAVFADKIEFYRDPNGGDGWRPVGAGAEPSFTWSGAVG